MNFGVFYLSKLKGCPCNTVIFVKLPLFLNKINSYAFMKIVYSEYKKTR